MSAVCLHGCPAALSVKIVSYFNTSAAAERHVEEARRYRSQSDHLIR